MTLPVPVLSPDAWPPGWPKPKACLDSSGCLRSRALAFSQTPRHPLCTYSQRDHRESKPNRTPVQLPLLRLLKIPHWLRGPCAPI